LTGNEATAIGFIAASQLSGRPLFYGSYPITPASDILHELSLHKSFGVRTFQAEDEIAAVCAAIGASFTGHIGLTGTSGPGVALKQEAIGLAYNEVDHQQAYRPRLNKLIYFKRCGDEMENVLQSSLLRQRRAIVSIWQ
jgi:hypothetical protein